MSYERNKMKIKIKITLIDVIVIIASAFLFADMIKRLLDLSSGFGVLGGILFSILMILFLNFIGRNVNNPKYNIPFCLFPLFIVYFSFLYEKLFGAFDFGAILFHIEMGVENATSYYTFYRVAFRYLLLFSLLSLCLIYLVNKFRFVKLIDRVIALPILLTTPIAFHFVGSLYYIEYRSIMLPLFHDIGKDLSLSENPKNIILIYAESGERTYQYLENGRNIYAPFIDVASKGLEVVGVEQVTNTGWTVAGLVASQCGTSLQPVGLMRHNNFKERKDFLPGVVCLSDVLAAHGYVNEFLNGADLAFAGMNNFLPQHNYQRFNGLHTYENMVGDYINFWGLYDDTLLEIAANRVKELQEQKQPFLFTVMTIGGHSPVGHVTQKCKSELTPASSKEILFAVQCMGHHIKEFIETLENEGLLKNTIVMVMSDHLVMATDVVTQLNKHKRLNYFTLIGDDIEVGLIKKKSATFDIYPTLLEVLGFDLPSRKAGLGVSMLSDMPSLVEQLGSDQLNKMLEFDKSLAKKLWFPKATAP